MKITPNYKEIDQVELSHFDMVHLINLLPNVDSISFEIDENTHTFENLKDLEVNSNIDKVDNLKIEYSKRKNSIIPCILKINTFGPRHHIPPNNNLRAVIDNFLRQKVNLKLDKSLIHLRSQHNNDINSRVNIKGNNNIVGNNNNLSSLSPTENKSDDADSKNVLLRMWKSIYTPILAPILVAVITLFLTFFIAKYLV